MATVRFSEDLKTRITTNAASKFQPAVNAAKQSQPTGWGDRIYDRLFAKYVSVFPLLPDGFYNHSDNIRVLSVMGLKLDIRFEFTTNRPYPNPFPDMEIARKTNETWNTGVILTGDAWLDLHTEFSDWIKRVEHTVQRQREFVSEVKKIVNSFATLAPALKAWPPLWDLVPEDIKERHRLVIEREKRVVDHAADLERLTVLATINKITGG